MAKRLLREKATHNGEDAEIARREQGAFLREVSGIQAVRQAKVPVQAPQPVSEEKEDDMEKDEEGPEEEGHRGDTRETPGLDVGFGCCGRYLCRGGK